MKNKAKNELVTKKDLQATENYLNFRIDSVENELREFRKEFSEFKEYVTKTLDWLVGAFKKFDEEHTILSRNYSKIRASVDDHERRITIIEKNN